MSTEEGHAERKDEILELIRRSLPPGKFKDVVPTRWPKRYIVFIDAWAIRPVMEALKAAGFDRFIAIEAIDWYNIEPVFELLYYIESVKLGGPLVIVRTKIPRSNPEIDTIRDIYPLAHWQEIENYEFFGIKFKGHPDLRLWILEDNWEGPPPLRKDFDTVKYVLETYYGGKRWERPVKRREPPPPRGEE